MMRPLVAGVLALGCFVGAYLVLTNQTPACYANGHRIPAGRYVTSHHRPDGSTTVEMRIPAGVSGCSSDVVLPWEATVAALLAVAGLCVPLVLLRVRKISVAAAVIGKTILGLVTIMSLFDLIGAGAFVAPLLIPFLWLAARSATRWAKGAWIFLASLCGGVAGMLIAFSLGHLGIWEYLIPTGFAALVAILFVGTCTNGMPPRAPAPL